VQDFGLSEYFFRSEWNGMLHLHATGGCDWCDRPLQDIGKSLRVYFGPDGQHLETDLLCEPCDRYGPPGGSRRQRMEAAWTIQPQMSRLEKLGWALIHRARR
jgi:hypothetical protein